MSKFFDFDSDDDDTKIQPRATQEDALDSHTPAICDTDGSILQPYGQSSLICPTCMTVTNPTFQVIKHDTKESTLEELDDLNSGELSFLENDRLTVRKSKIRKKLDETELPSYIKEEIERIQYRAGYKTIPIDKKLFNNDIQQRSNNI